MSHRKSVALLVETSTHYGRQLLAGILRYKIERANWRIHMEQQDLNSAPPARLHEWKGDGIICRLTNPEIAQIAIDREIPFVELNDRVDQTHDVVTLRSDDEMIGVQAAEHFIERGFRHFAFVGSQGEAWSDRRNKGFRERVVSDQFEYAYYGLPNSMATHLEPDEGLANWLLELPKPVGIMACNDIHAKLALDLCQAKNIVVPEQVAVVGVDNDELICKFCEPMLSSVATSAVEVGYRAAESLGKLMNNEPVSPMLQVIEPLDICVRASTDTLAIKDDEFAKAMVYIRRFACEGITVEDVITHAKLSRSSLERRTRKLMNKSPQQFIRQVQLERVKTLLADTDLLIEAIADKCGFGHPEYLHVTFKREFKMTPGEFRRSVYR